MINVVEINTIEDANSMIMEAKYRPEIDRFRSHYVFRGMPDVSYPLTTSLARNCKGHAKELESAILRNFTKYAALEDESIERSVWRQMILGQHHGLPTRMLDWSHSSLVGMHFAVTETDLDQMEEHDSVVWRIDMTELHNLLPEKYRAKMDADQTVIFDVDRFAEVCPTIDQYDADMGDSAMVIIEPPSMDRRIINQYSFFSIVPDGMSSVEEFLEKKTEHTSKFIINRKLRWQIRDSLDQLNISERIVYPGLDGLSKWLGRHYFVKK